MGSYIEKLPGGYPLEILAIPSGLYLMGSPDEYGDNDEHPQHRVAVRPFYLGKYPVTQIQWQAIATLTPVERELPLYPSRFKGDDRPVEQVSWLDAVEWCARLARFTGRPYRLPSEAEWEYACRGGKALVIGKDVPDEGKANFNGKETTPVGMFPHNAFGLCDMQGNVWEWCTDNLHDNYEGAPPDSRAWESDRECLRVFRGGSWGDEAYECRSTHRGGALESFKRDLDDNYSYGFRVACSA